MFLVHAKVCAMVDYEFVDFIERTLVEQHVDTFAGCHVTVGVLFFHAFYTAALRSQLVQFLKFLILFCCCHCSSSLITSNVIIT